MKQLTGFLLIFLSILFISACNNHWMEENQRLGKEKLQLEYTLDSLENHPIIVFNKQMEKVNLLMKYPSVEDAEYALLLLDSIQDFKSYNTSTNKRWTKDGVYIRSYLSRSYDSLYQQMKIFYENGCYEEASKMIHRIPQEKTDTYTDFEFYKNSLKKQAGAIPGPYLLELKNVYKDFTNSVIELACTNQSSEKIDHLWVEVSIRYADGRFLSGWKSYLFNNLRPYQTKTRIHSWESTDPKDIGKIEIRMMLLEKNGKSSEWESSDFIFANPNYPHIRLTFSE